MLYILGKQLLTRHSQKGPALGAGIGRIATALGARHISIPADKLEFNFTKSSGPGGQNVNKVNTRAELRFNVIEAEW